MKYRSPIILTTLILLFSGSNIAQSQDTLRVMNYNILKYPSSSPERHQYLRKIVHFYKPDVVAVNELQDSSAGKLLLDTAFNEFGVTHWKKAKFVDGPYSDNLLYYNSDKLGLDRQHQIPTQLRDISRYRLYYKDVNFNVCHNDTSYLDIFSLHLKAGTSEELQRAEEAGKLMNTLDTMPSASNVIVCGDYNIYDPTTEPVWDTLTEPSNTNTLQDPINRIGDWHSNSQYADIHTQSTRTSSCTGTGPGSTGGMDDRFDLNLVDADIMNGTNRFRYIQGSYFAAAQDGQHLNDCLIDPPQIPNVPDSVVDALYNMSDHLPVFMDIAFECNTSYLTGTQDTIEICQGDRAQIGTQYYYTTGTYYDTTYIENGCNCMTSTFLDVEPVDTTVIRDGDSLVAPASNATFQWIDCGDGQPIPGETDSILKPASTGAYSVIVSQDTCTDTSNCHQVNYASLQERSLEGSVKVFPNPGRDRLNISFTQQGGPVSIRVHSLSGRFIMEEHFIDRQKVSLDVSPLPRGAYSIEVIDERDGRRAFKAWMKY